MGLVDAKDCLRKGVLAGIVGGAAGGLPSLLMLDRNDLHESIRSIAHLVPGNHVIRSPRGRWILGAQVHMSISITFATLYVCRIKKRPLLFGAALWAIAYKGLGPTAMKEQDKSKALADHLLWALIVDQVSRRGTSTTSSGRG